jgi:hypothetical protein
MVVLVTGSRFKTKLLLSFLITGDAVFLPSMLLYTVPL